MADYDPKPLDTSKVQLSDEIYRLAELFAQNAHDVWARQRLDEGWTFGPSRNDDLLTHPCLIPYENLPESEKVYDRQTALETIKTLVSLGYRKESIQKEQLAGGGDLEAKAAQVVQRLKDPEFTLADLRRVWNNRLQLVWFRDVQIYRRAVDLALKMGESFLGFDIATEGLQAFPDDLRLIQLQALALARSGATRRANTILQQLRQSGHQDEETLGILARTYKDFWQFSLDEDEKRDHLKNSFSLYLEGYKRNGGYYSGINAATTGLLYGETDTARKIAGDVVALCRESLDQLDAQSGERYWLEATLAEAALILGDLDTAEEFYRNSSQAAGISTVIISRTRSQARFLLDHITGDANRLDHCFQLPRIAVFSGHMFDQPGRKKPRFPYLLETFVREQMKMRIEKHRVQTGFSSLACGGDLIFTECLLEQGGEVHLILPFPAEDFKKVSVELVPGMNWGERFDSVYAKAAKVTVLSELGDARGGAAFEFANQALIGLSLLHSAFVGMDVVPLVLWDRQPGDGRGGTQTVVEFWETVKKTQVDIIHLRPESAAEAVAGKSLEEQFPGLCLEESPTVVLREGPAPPEQEIKALIFSDIVGFTKLLEEQIPSFVEEFLGRVSKLLEGLPHAPIHRNTWGDAVCCVFDRVQDAGNFALAMRDMVVNTDWAGCSLPSSLSIRIALNAGPVFRCYDPVLGKWTFNGSHVNRTARIEPIAEEGQVYASEAFAALAAAEGVEDFTCDYVGNKQLAKKYGSIPVFLVRRTR